MKIKTSELEGVALNWAVAKCERFKVSRLGPGNKHGVYRVDGESWYETRTPFTPSTEWDQGGLIIARERITIRHWDNVDFVTAYMPQMGSAWHHGPTPLIAAMRCYVASKLGEEVDVPDELIVLGETK